ncbi:MAG: outer membrane beta-barrel protein [Flavobacteriales bacterium]|nr:outer membrane beta-barrel protein [Flavobacteriales bacterium]
MKLNWSTFLGSDTPDSLGLYRIFNSAWWSWEGEKWGAKVAADIGIQEMATSTKWNLWADGVIVIHRRLGKQLFATARGEYYYDPHQVIVYIAPPIIGSPRGLTATGYSLGLDYHITSNSTVRLEGRLLRSTFYVFEFQDRATQDNTSVTVSIAAKF